MSDETELPDGVDESLRGAWDAWLSLGMDNDGDMFTDAYAGTYARHGEYAEELISDVENIPEYIAGYVDYELVERDMELNGDISVVRESWGNIHVFRNW